MKRFFVLALTLSVSKTIFASDFSTGSDAFTIATIILLIWGVLEIILFFKIWGMTNDVKAMKKDHFNENAFSSTDEMAQYIRKNMILGNTGDVKRVLLQNFMDYIQKLYNSYSHQFGVPTRDEKGEQHFVQLTKEQIMELPLVPYVESLQKQFDKIGEELPACVKSMSTFGDFFSIFLKEDLEIEEQPMDSPKKSNE